MSLILPLAAQRLGSNEFLLWQLLATVQTLVFMLDLGVTPTFTRMFAYARGGRSVPELSAGSASGALPESQLNVATAAAIWATLRPVVRLSAASAAILGFAVAAIILQPRVVALASPLQGWLALAAVTLTSPLGLLALAYGALAQGLDHVAELRRWEALTGLGALGLQLLALLVDGGLVSLVVAAQIGLAVSFARNVWLVHKVARPVLVASKSITFDRQVWQAVWPATWRSGVGTLCASGFIQATGLICDQWGRNRPEVVSSYLLGLRLITAVSQFSQAPFYSRLPRLTRLFASGDRGVLVAQAERGMRLSYLAFALGAGLLGLVGPWLTRRLGFQAKFPDPSVWWLLTAAIYTERAGAMHLQLYSLTNRIHWHIAASVSGIISALTLAGLLPRWGILAFPAAYWVGNLLFFAPYTIRLSYSEFKMPFPRYEWRTSVIGAGLLMLFALATSA
jgi:hypothetical protein